MEKTTPKKRLDLVMVERGLAPSRQRAKALIMAGKILVDNQPMDKPGSPVPDGAKILVKGQDLPYVSRGGLKLEAALLAMQLDVSDLICLDIGASTGGFTDCLLQHGAKFVYAVDVGYGQLAWSLRQDRRVACIERCNIRHMPTDKIPDLIDLVTIDVSFISLKLVVPQALRFLKSDGLVLGLIKPQFEVGKGKVGKGGVVREPELITEVIQDLTRFFQEDLELKVGPIVPSPILGPKGNQEYIIRLDR